MSNDRLLFWLGLLAAAAVMAALVFPTTGGRVYYPSDLGEYHLPLRQFYAGCLASGEDFRWCPLLQCGFDLHGEGQVGMYHPLHLLLYGLLPLESAFNLELLASYPLMLLGMFGLLRRWELGRGPAVFGGFCFAFSGFNLLHFIHPNGVAVVAHLPWLLWAIDVACREQGRRAGAARVAVAALTGSQLLLGYPQYVFLSCVAEGLYLLLVWPGWRGALGLALAKGLGGLVGGAQLVPTAAAAAASTRATPDAAFSSSLSLHPLNLGQLLAPYLLEARSHRGYTHETALYDGAVTMALWGWLWIRRRELEPGWRRLALAATALGALALLLSFGRFGGVYPWLARLPLVGLFRAPARFAVLVHLALALGAAVALADLARCREAPRWWRCWPLGALVLASLVGGAAHLWPTLSDRVAAPRFALAGPALILVACGLVLLAARGKQAALVCLLLLGCADQAVYGLSWLWRYPPTTTIGLLADGTPAPPRPADGRVAGARNTLALRGIRLADGYLGLPPRHDRNLRDERDLRLSGVQWRLVQGVWLSVPGALPRARVGRGRARLEVDRPGRLEVAVQTPVAGRLVVDTSHHKGWRATLDGEPVPTKVAAGGFLACDVPAGRSRVVWRFEPVSHQVGARLSLLGLVLGFLWLLLSLVGGGRGAAPGDAPSRGSDASASP